MMRLSHPFIAELKRYVANQKSNLSPIIMSISDIINTNKQSGIIYEKQRKLSEVADMIHAAYVFHRCIQDENLDTSSTSTSVKRDNIMSLLIGDYLLAQSSVDLADIRWPETVGLIAKGLEDYTRGEFMKLNSPQDSPSKSSFNYDLYAELTCGSLLANACKSVALLGGQAPQFGHLVYNFGLHAGTAHRLMECSIEFETSKEKSPSISENYFKKIVKSRLDNAMEILLKLPMVDERPSLISRLDEIMLNCK